MPQLIPFYWVNQIVWTFGGLFAIAYIISVFVLPMFLELSVVRTYITKL